MNVINFLKTIYLGDRFCTKIVFDGFQNHIELHINLISRIRDSSGEWNFYTDEDINDGIFVFTGINKIIFDPSGLIPNDQIYDIYADKADSTFYQFTVETSHIDKNARTHDITIKIIAEGLYLIDPKKPNFKITE